VFVYDLVPGATIATSAAPNTEVDEFFAKPGTRNISLQAYYFHGRGAGLTQLSGITMRLKKFTTTSTVINTGTALTPSTNDPGVQAAKMTSAWASAGALTVGTGGPVLLASVGCGATGPGGWVAQNPDSMKVLEGSANNSLDLFSASGTASMIHEFMAEIQE
jgi:hypothetical protein